MLLLLLSRPDRLNITILINFPNLYSSFSKERKNCFYFNFMLEVHIMQPSSKKSTLYKYAAEHLFAEANWWRERDSNPRCIFRNIHDFQSCSFSHSDTSPRLTKQLFQIRSFYNFFRSRSS